jgi:hypothetical protein
MIPELLTYNTINQQLVVNNSELLAISCFNKLITTFEDDNVTLTQVLGYIYWNSSIYSPGILRGLNDLQLIENAKTTLGIPFDWEADDTINECIKYYKKSTDSVQKETLVELLISLKSIKDSVKLINKGLQVLINEVDSETKLDLKHVNELISYNKSISDVIKNIPDNIDKLNELISSVTDKDRQGRTKARGDVDITGSMLDD